MTAKTRSISNNTVRLTRKVDSGMQMTLAKMVNSGNNPVARSSETVTVTGRISVKSRSRSGLPMLINCLVGVDSGVTRCSQIVKRYVDSYLPFGSQAAMPVLITASRVYRLAARL